MSASEGQSRSSRGRWRAPAIGAVTGLAVATAIVVPSAIAAGGQTAGQCVAAKSARVGVSSRAAAGGATGAAVGDPQAAFFAAVARLAQDGTINASQAQVLDTDIRSGSVDPKKLIADGVLTASQMKAVNDRLVAVKVGIASQVHAANSSSQSGSAKAGG